MELSKAAYYADLILYPLLVVGLCAREMAFVHAFPYVWLCSMALGLLTWTIVEYGVHRFVLHSLKSVARLHELHHATPSAYVGTPTWLSLLSFGLGGFIPLLILFGREVASGATMGLMFGYLWYLLIHDVVHRRHPRRGSLLYRAKIHHARHHYAKVPGNFGVTSSFWDRFFGTHIVSDKPIAAQVVRSGATWSNSAASSRTDTGNLANPGWRFRCAPMRERE
jgi:sterol desaturase/sphingolipid hydroxylase (fatty acid hydroxylase superfamily)